MNKLLVPEVGVYQFLKDMLINPKKVSMSSFWWASPIFVSVIVGAIVSQIFCRITGDDILLASFLFCLAFYIGSIMAIRNFRKKIMADIESAGNFSGTYGFYCSDNLRDQSFVDVSTMAGKLTFVCEGSSMGLIEKKSGRYFNYYAYSDVEGINSKDLRIFIAGESKLDIVPGSILGTCQ